LPKISQRALSPIEAKVTQPWITGASLALSCFVNLAGCAIISQLEISAFDISTLLLLGANDRRRSAVGIIRHSQR
jgi:hypothetical protein